MGLRRQPYAFTEHGVAMAVNKLVQARIDGAVKEEADAVRAAMGLTVSDAVRLLLTRVAQEKALLFAPLIPNAVTIEALKEVEGAASTTSAPEQPLPETEPSSRWPSFCSALDTRPQSPN